MSKNPTPLRVLVVDDDPSVRTAYANVLAPRRVRRTTIDNMELGLFGSTTAKTSGLVKGLEVACASQGQEALGLVERAVAEGRPFAVAFIDMRMPPGWDGLETAERIRAVDPRIQIVIATAYSDRAWDDVVRRLGRVDSLLLLKKPFDANEVQQMAAALGEKWRLAQAAAAELAESKRLAAGLQAANADLEREVADRQAAERKLHRHAYYDTLTGLSNRYRLLDRLETAFARRRRDPTFSFAVLYFDLDSFKLVNDGLGHDMGDKVLVEIARRLTSGLRGADAVTRADDDAASRLGGDEFVVVLEGIHRHVDAAVVAERLLRMISQPIDLGVQQIALAASVGVAVAEERHNGAEEILRDADMAMYRAKFDRLRIAMFDPAMRAAAGRRLSIESDLRRAVEARHFHLVFQPICHAADGRISALEALVRWNHPDYPVRQPAEFIPVAEETGLIVPLGRWILEEACRTLAAIRASEPEANDVRMSVNVSRRQLLEPRFAADVRDILERTGVPACRVDLEITESAIIGDEQAALARLAELKRIGVGIHLDDFGTGYSSLSCLQKFPLDLVKVDRSFIRDLGDVTVAAAVVEAIVPLSHRMGMQVTVEGVETQPQLAALQALGIDFVQGFLLHRPDTIEAVIALLHARSAPVEGGQVVPTA
jgi:diguanylate cyclase (GGDEF)-like protein